MVIMKHALLWVVMPNSVVDVDQHFGESCSSPLHGWRYSKQAE
jgi:hypothetical protein